MSKKDPFKYYKTSPEIIKLAVMYYIRFPLSLRQVEDILHERGIDICHETIRYWWNKFGTLFANDIKKKSNNFHSNWRWHIDEVFVKINGKTYYLWRAVDHEGTILESYVSKRRDKKAARKVLIKLISKYGKPKEIVTDKLPSYKAELKELRIAHLQNTDQYLNNQCENSHLHFRRREKMMNKFRSHKSLQKFTSIHATFLNHFNHQRHIETRKNFKNLRQHSIESWNNICIG
jgi:putative transposase